MCSVDISLLKSKVDIVEFIGRYVSLIRCGSSIKCCCPFHQEKTPSFFVDQLKQIFRCFGCGISGDVIGFLMEIDNINFQSAISVLAKEVGMTIEHEKEAPSIIHKKQTIASISKFFQQQLLLNKLARNYLLIEREFSQNEIDNFKIGYCPESNAEILKYVESEGLDRATLFELGVLVESNKIKNKVTVFCPFHNRIVFPIFNVSNEIIAFGARKICESVRAPKYINSKENKLFVKRECLYGLFQKNLLCKDKSAILVEGYTDVIALSQFGFSNAFASMGTSIREEQLLVLWHRLGYSKIYVCFDGDGAGTAAMLRLANIALKTISAEKEIYFSRFSPDGDPCSVIKRDVNLFKKIISAGTSLNEFIVTHAVEKQGKKLTVNKMALIRKEIKSLFNTMKDKDLMEEYKRFAESKISNLSPYKIEDTAIDTNISRLRADLSAPNATNSKLVEKKFNRQPCKQASASGYNSRIDYYENKVCELEIGLALNFPDILLDADIEETFSDIMPQSKNLCHIKEKIRLLLSENAQNKSVLKDLITGYFPKEIKDNSFIEDLDSIDCVKDAISFYRNLHQQYNSFKKIEKIKEILPFIENDIRELKESVISFASSLNSICNSFKESKNLFVDFIDSYQLSFKKFIVSFNALCKEVRETDNLIINLVADLLIK